MLLTLLAATTPGIELNQLGFRPDAPKHAILPSQSERPVRWRVVDAQDRTVLDGETEVAQHDAALGYRPHRIDLSALRITGEGYRVVAGDAASDRFAIRPNLYRPLARDALAFFYHQRAGTPIEARFAGGAQWARPAAHTGERVTCFDGKDQRGNLWPGCRYTLDVTGGWYDAGDHGKYVVNGGITVWTLLNLYERLPGAFPDRAQPIPEAVNGVSDLLDEVRWQVEFLLKIQVPDGSRQQLAVGQRDGRKPLTMREVDTSGMAHHKVASERWTALPMRPDRDPERRLLYPPSTAATLNLAAVAAQCARVWRTIDPAFAARCRTAAERAWTAAERNPDIFAVGDFTGSGGYGDNELSDERFWAAAELFATTSDARYRAALQASPHFTQPIGGEPGWPATAPLGVVTLATVSNALPKPEIDRLRGLIIAAATRFADERDRAPYRIPFASDRYSWGSNSNLLNRAMLLAMAADWTGDARYRIA